MSCAWAAVALALPAPGGAQTRVSIEAERWLLDGLVTYRGQPAEGLLMNVRVVNSVFEDTGPAAADNLPPGYDPEENTAAFIARIPAYVASGVRAFTVSLQGGHPGYEGAVNSAFEADGRLRVSYLARVRSVIEACDRAGCVVILSCFYQRQHSHERALSGRAAIEAAVDNVAAWIREEGFTNVALEIANEYAHDGFRNWNDGDWLRTPEAQVALIERARAVHPELLVSTSGLGGGRIDARIAKAADFVLIHFNRTAITDFGARIAEARAHGKPVVGNEDDKVGAAGAEAAAEAVRHGASWGFMHSGKNQRVPFEFAGPDDDPVAYARIAALTGAGEGGDPGRGGPVNLFDGSEPPGPYFFLALVAPSSWRTGASTRGTSSCSLSRPSPSRREPPVFSHVHARSGRQAGASITTGSSGPGGGEPTAGPRSYSHRSRSRLGS